MIGFTFTSCLIFVIRNHLVSVGKISTKNKKDVYIKKKFGYLLSHLKEKNDKWYIYYAGMVILVSILSSLLWPAYWFMFVKNTYFVDHDKEIENFDKFMAEKK